MKPLAIGRRIRISIRSSDCDLTMTEILSDPIVAAMMKADRVDPAVLEAQLHGIAQKVAATRGWTVNA